MSNKPPFVKAGARLPLLTVLGLLLVLAFIGFRFKTSNPDLESRFRNMVKKEETLSRMRIDLIRSVAIEKGAVMADTDELSRALAEESLRAAEAVERNRLELIRLTEHDPTDKEMELLREFDTCWAELRKIDKVLLDFAVVNSNLKASNLSFTRGSQALKRFRQNLADLIDGTSSNPQCSRILRLACDALTAGFEIHYLHAPHIAAANDMDMDRIETEIRQLDEVISRSLEELKYYLPEANQAILQEAGSAYAEFNEVTAMVLGLSRQNTEIKSFELSLGRKRRVTAQCDEILTSLQSVLHSRTFEATR